MENGELKMENQQRPLSAIAAPATGGLPFCIAEVGT
jgi:hypothetical protein